MAREGPSPSRCLKLGARARTLKAQLKRGWAIEAQSSRCPVCVGGGVGGQREKKKKRPQPSSTEIRPLRVLLCLVKDWRKDTFREARRICDSVARKRKAGE